MLFQVWKKSSRKSGLPEDIFCSAIRFKESDANVLRSLFFKTSTKDLIHIRNYKRQQASVSEIRRMRACGFAGQFWIHNRFLLIKCEAIGQKYVFLGFNNSILKHNIKASITHVWRFLLAVRGVRNVLCVWVRHGWFKLLSGDKIQPEATNHVTSKI